MFALDNKKPMFTALPAKFYLFVATWSALHPLGTSCLFDHGLTLDSKQTIQVLIALQITWVWLEHEKIECKDLQSNKNGKTKTPSKNTSTGDNAKLDGWIWMAAPPVGMNAASTSGSTSE